MKITLSWYSSESNHGTHEWETDYADMWPVSRSITDMLELRRLKIENAKLKAEKPAATGVVEPDCGHGKPWKNREGRCIAPLFVDGEAKGQCGYPEFMEPAAEGKVQCAKSPDGKHHFNGRIGGLDCLHCGPDWNKPAASGEDRA